MNVEIDIVKNVLIKFLQIASDDVITNKFMTEAYPVVFVDQEFETLEPIPIVYKDGDSQDEIASLLDIGAACWFEEAEYVIINLEACARKTEDFQSVIDNYETERPSSYPPSMRDSYIISCLIDLIDEDFVFLMSKYNEEHDDLKFEEPILIESKNVLLSGLVDFIIQGWNLMHRFLSDEEEFYNDQTIPN